MPNSETIDYWREWVRYLSIPLEWQDAVIRSAITLKLCQYEDTGAIVAALTTSIPEAPHTPRNWDYRYCWLRDAAFVVRALNRLGATAQMEEYIRYIFNLVDRRATRHCSRCTASASRRSWPRTMPSLAGYRGMGPVRVGNLAWVQKQHDVYGSVVLGVGAAVLRPAPGAPRRRRDVPAAGAARRTRVRACTTSPMPACGNSAARAHVHTYSAVMCWAACDRLAKIAARFGLTERVALLARPRRHASASAILREAWNEERGHFADAFGGERLDASLLLLADLGFVEADDPRFIATVEAIGKRPGRGNGLFRYIAPDDFGAPETSFTICTFWYIEALAAIGRKAEAREMFERVLARRNPLGLLSEDLAFDNGEAWGNFPQTYSHVGLINAAMRLAGRGRTRREGCETHEPPRRRLQPRRMPHEDRAPAALRWRCMRRCRDRRAVVRLERQDRIRGDSGAHP